MSGSHRIVGPGPLLLVHNGEPIAPLLVANSVSSRSKGLLGSSGIEGALWLEPCASVHMMGMRYPIDAASLAGDGIVLHVATLRPWLSWTPPRCGARITLEAPAGFFAGHGIRVGDHLAIGGIN
ncbi:MAG: DUF192 domain-containing protein [Micropruina sp.]